ncbi:uncharacterized protein LOC142230840 [Haematobia irritans]|uniref:uncharacterized protein LOC142230840 n=1 Tax=Haematobia irritans TaxID=7368 RepID=UPI003F506675
MLFGSLLIHLTVFLLRRYIIHVNRSNVPDIPVTKADSSLLQESKPSADDILINIGEWKSTLGSVDLKQFTLTRASQIEPVKAPEIISRQYSFYFEELLDSISLSNVVYNMLQTTSTPLCGMMFIFSISYILLHLINEYSFMANNLDLAMIQNKVKHRDLFLKRSIFLMDIYFLINGANLSYDFFSSLPKNNLYTFGQMKHAMKLIIYKIVG